MDRIPAEILHRIFIKLHIRQRLECTLVCKHWSSLLRARSLFHTVIIENELMCNRFLEMIERFPLRAYQVEHLELLDGFTDPFDKRKICTIFPKLRIIKLTSSRIIGESNYFRNKPIEYTFPSNQIEELADYEECELVYELIAAGLCSHLRILHLDITYMHNTFVNFIPSLKNLPVLKELSAEGLPIRIDDMETIHENIPSLEVLKLTRCSLVESILPITIERVPLTSLSISMEPNSTGLNRQLMWLEYIGLKYISLKKLWLWSESNEKPSFDISNFYSHLLSKPVSTYAKLESLPPLGPKFDKTMVEKLEKSGIQLKSCKFIQSFLHPRFKLLSDSSLAKNIEELHLIDLIMNEYEWLNNLTKLKRLHLSYFASDEDDHNRSTRLHISDLLKFLPKTVEAISIENVHLSLLIDKYQQFPAVKELNLINVDTELDFHPFTEFIFPKLKIFRLENCFFSVNSVTVRRLDLSLLEITTSAGPHEMANVYLFTGQNDKSYRYPVKSQSFFSENIQPDLYIDHNHIRPEQRNLAAKFLAIFCHSVDTLIVNKVVYASS